MTANEEHREVLPRVVEWEPKWKAPIVRAACPSCGRVADRRASSWSAKTDGSLDARFACWPIGEPRPECARVFDVHAARDSGFDNYVRAGLHRWIRKRADSAPSTGGGEQHD